MPYRGPIYSYDDLKEASIYAIIAGEKTKLNLDSFTIDRYPGYLEDCAKISFEASTSFDTILYKKEYRIENRIKKVIFNDPATIVFWRDGTKTVVKCQENDKYDKMTGLAMAISKKAFGNKGRYYDIFKKWCEED